MAVDGADALLRVVDYARQLNRTIDVARLERMRFIFRSWISTAASVEGGFSLTQDELECVLEYPPSSAHIAFLMDTFRTNKRGDEARIDLLTLLAACTCLARGSLEAKATFLFSLVDFDTEDEIVEDELAMIIALCSDGLKRLGVIVTDLSDLDARALACEAFEFVNVDDGGKMNRALFLQWLVSHWRPAALFDRLQSLFLISRVAQRLHEALQEHTQVTESSPFHVYNRAHFENDVEAEKTKVVVGPIIGPTTTTEVRILLEVNRKTRVQVFAFRAAKMTEFRQASSDRKCTIEFEAWIPQVVVIDGLLPEETYQVRLLGVCKRDRERRVAIATTQRQDVSTRDGDTVWGMCAMNHEKIGQHADAYRRLRNDRLKAAEAKSVILAVHFSAVHLRTSTLINLMELLSEETDRATELARHFLYQGFRDSLNHPELWEVLRIGSSLIVTTRFEFLRISEHLGPTEDSNRDRMSVLMQLALTPWRMYIGNLWGIDSDDVISTIHQGDSCILLKYRLYPRGFGLAEVLPTITSPRHLVVVTTEPMLPPYSSASAAGTLAASDEARLGPPLDEMSPLVDWKRGDIGRNVCVVSRHPVAGFQSHYNARNTAICIEQVLCGPASGCADGAKILVQSTSTDLSEAIVSISASTTLPHCAIIHSVVGESSSRPSSHAASSRPATWGSIRSSQGDGSVYHTQLFSRVSVLSNQCDARVITGPVIRMVSEQHATVILECEEDRYVSVCLTDRLTQESFVASLNLRRYRPSECIVKNLRPGRGYHVSVPGMQTVVEGIVQTPCREPAAIRMLLLAADSFCDQPTTARRRLAPDAPTSHMGNILEHLARGPNRSSAAIMYDMAIHIGSTATLRDDLLHGHELLRQELMRPLPSSLEEMVRECYRSYVAIPDVRTLRSLGANWFSGIGVARSLLQKEAPIRLLRTVTKVMAEYESSDVTLDHHESGLVHKLANQVFAIKLDTTECLVDAPSSEFIEWPEHLLTTRQQSAVRYVLSHHRIGSSPTSRQLLVLCDAPFVWPFTVNTVRHRTSEIDNVLEVAGDPWSFYSHDLRQLLNIIFDAIAKDDLLRVTLVCNGIFASRVVISHKPTGRSIEQLTLGTISNIDSGQTPARYTPELVHSRLGDDYTISGHPTESAEVTLKQYCVLDVVPHARGAVCSHSFYTAGRPEASIVFGPVIGRVTTRSARILIEVDRPVQTVSCILHSASSGHSVTADSEIQAFVPTVFKLEGLHPGTRYKIKFEGLMIGESDIDACLETPVLMPLTVEWLVISRNNLTNFLSAPETRGRPKSHWRRILSPGSRSHNTKIASSVSNRNGDFLGESIDQQSDQFNPWYHVEAFALSEPLRQTQLSVHIGGQVDFRSAFAEDELCKMVVQLCDSMLPDESKEDLYRTIRYRLQEVYRNTWAVEPVRTVMSYTSNVMLLDEETDLFFSACRLQELTRRHSTTDNSVDVPTDGQVSQVATRLRAMAFELWQLYQNQLVVDVNESDLDNSRRSSSKFASQLTFGMCRLVFVNVSDEIRDMCSSTTTCVNDKTHPVDHVAPLTFPQASDDAQVLLLSSATWKIVDEALDNSAPEDGAGDQSRKRAKAKASSSIKQLVIFVAVDVIEVVTSFPAVRADVVRLLEKLFHWKLGAREERQVTLICPSTRSSSLSFVVTDEKVNESLELTRISSISELQEAQFAKPVQAKSKFSSNPTASIKGYFSKRFTYQSTPSSSGAPSRATHCRSYANYLFLSDYRHGFLNESVLCFPSRAMAKIVLGPVIGRVVCKQHEEPRADAANDPVQLVSYSVPILVEIDASARLTCVVVDSMINTEIRVTKELQPFEPTVICIPGLVPHRRYVYFFEGVSNSDTRRGSLHTPPSDSSSLNLVAVSSNFPTHMDEEQDSLWKPLVERAKLPWCGLDAILHLGGQVPLHEAAIECFDWANRELRREILHGNLKEVDAKRVQHVRARVRRRFQQEYRICWNLPNIRELLAHASHWFVQSKADVAPFFGCESPRSPEATRTTNLIIEVAKEVVFAYQLQLVMMINEELHAEPKQQTDDVPMNETKPVDTRTEAISTTTVAKVPEATASGPNGELLTTEEKSGEAGDDDGTPANEVLDTGGATYWQHDDIAVFMADVRSVGVVSSDSVPEPITCNGRLSRPLARQENPKMSETQWRYFESVLRKKRTQLLILCLEVPLILTNATHVEKLRDELRPSSGCKLYDQNHVLQHWVACKRQLEQLLLLLFKWKAKRSGRDVLILSGGMRIGIDTLLQDRETNLSIRNLTVGPVTAAVETFEFPLNGVACATFGGGLKDDHFTFHHTLLAKKNYLLLHVAVELPVDPSTKVPSEAKTSNVVAEFVPNEPAVLSRLHPIDKFRRFPRWWTAYVPMGAAVFWDDTITLKSETDDRMLALRDYLWRDRGFSGALEVFYEKYEFAETARMEDLRSRHAQHVDLKANFMGVLHELWRAIPESKRQQMAYFLDPFVLDMLMNHVAPDLFTKRMQSGESMELAYFSRVLREFVFDACLLRLTIITQQEDEVRAHQAAVEQRKLDDEAAAKEKARAEIAAQQEAERMAELLRTDPLQYATIKLAQEEAEMQEKLARHQEKLQKKKAERLAELEEEQAIAKEQKKLNKLAERDPLEYERRQHELDARIRKLEEKRAQRAAQKKAVAEKTVKETPPDQ